MPWMGHVWASQSLGLGEGQDAHLERAGRRSRQESRRLQRGSEDDVVLASLRSEDITSCTSTEIISRPAKLGQSESHWSTKENLKKLLPFTGTVGVRSLGLNCVLFSPERNNFSLCAVPCCSWLFFVLNKNLAAATASRSCASKKELAGGHPLPQQMCGQGSATVFSLCCWTWGLQILAWKSAGFIILVVAAFKFHLMSLFLGAKTLPKWRLEGYGRVASENGIV